MTDIKKLREEYKEVIGKNPFNGWKEEELQKRIDEFKIAKTKEVIKETKEINKALEDSGMVPKPATIEEVKEKLKTQSDLQPPVPEGEKADVDVIAELNKDSTVPEPKTVTEPAPDDIPVEDSKVPMEKFTKEVGLVILDRLYNALRDGKHRRMIIDIREKEIKKKKEFVQELQILMNSVYEGELKHVVLEYISQLAN